MSLPEDPKSDPPEGRHPPPLKPSQILDSMFQKGGPLSAAGFGIRFLALLLDYILVGAVSLLIVVKIFWPQEYPDAFEQHKEFTIQYQEWMKSLSDPEASLPLPEPSPEHLAALALANEVVFFSFWIYFAIGEAFFAGGSLGKRTCRIRSVSTVTLGPPNIFSGLTRGGLKTIALIAFPPLALLSAVFYFCNKRRQMGHDLLSRTAVVDERHMPQPEPVVES